jgi:hypothetical protein
VGGFGVFVGVSGALVRVGVSVRGDVAVGTGVGVTSGGVRKTVTSKRLVWLSPALSAAVTSKGRGVSEKEPGVPEKKPSWLSVRPRPSQN